MKCDRMFQDNVCLDDTSKKKKIRHSRRANDTKNGENPAKQLVQ